MEFNTAFGIGDNILEDDGKTYGICMQLHTNFIQALTVLKEKGGKVSELGCSEEKVAGIILSDVKLECKSLVPVSEDDGKSLSADVERHLSLVE